MRTMSVWDKCSLVLFVLSVTGRINCGWAGTGLNEIHTAEQRCWNSVPGNGEAGRWERVIQPMNHSQTWVYQLIFPCIFVLSCSPHFTLRLLPLLMSWPEKSIQMIHQLDRKIQWLVWKQNILEQGWCDITYEVLPMNSWPFEMLPILPAW